MAPRKKKEEAPPLKSEQGLKHLTLNYVQNARKKRLSKKEVSNVIASTSLQNTSERSSAALENQPIRKSLFGRKNKKEKKVASNSAQEIPTSRLRYAQAKRLGAFDVGESEESMSHTEDVGMSQSEPDSPFILTRSMTARPPKKRAKRNLHGNGDKKASPSVSQNKSLETSDEDSERAVAMESCRKRAKGKSPTRKRRSNLFDKNSCNATKVTQSKSVDMSFKKVFKVIDSFPTIEVDNPRKQTKNESLESDSDNEPLSEFILRVKKLPQICQDGEEMEMCDVCPERQSKEEVSHILNNSEPSSRKHSNLINESQNKSVDKSFNEVDQEMEVDRRKKQAEDEFQASNSDELPSESLLEVLPQNQSSCDDEMETDENSPYMEVKRPERRVKRKLSCASTGNSDSELSPIKSTISKVSQKISVNESSNEEDDEVESSPKMEQLAREELQARNSGNELSSEKLLYLEEELPQNVSFNSYENGESMDTTENSPDHSEHKNTGEISDKQCTDSSQSSFVNPRRKLAKKKDSETRRKRKISSENELHSNEGLPHINAADIYKNGEAMETTDDPSNESSEPKNKGEISDKQDTDSKKSSIVHLRRKQAKKNQSKARNSESEISSENDSNVELPQNKSVDSYEDGEPMETLEEKQDIDTANSSNVDCAKKQAKKRASPTRCNGNVPPSKDLSNALELSQNYSMDAHTDDEEAETVKSPSNDVSLNHSNISLSHLESTGEAPENEGACLNTFCDISEPFNASETSMKEYSENNNTIDVKNDSKLIFTALSTKAVDLKPLAATEAFTDASNQKPEVNKANFLPNFQGGLFKKSDVEAVRKKGIAEYLKKFKGVKVTTGFDYRITALEWHPFDAEIVAMASKQGELKIWHTGSDISEGPGLETFGRRGTIQAIKFDPWDPLVNILMVSRTGELLKYDYISHNLGAIVNMENVKRGYVSLDTHYGMGTMAIGDNEGSVTVLNSDGLLVGNYRLHKKTKVTHIEYSNIDPYMMCTASSDKSVKVWDTRMFGQKQCKPLVSLQHTTPVAGAVFSKTDECRLLTTDQDRHLNIYRAPLFALERTIIHPHKKFQLVPDFRAEWHPFEDIIAVGRNQNQNIEATSSSQINPSNTVVDFIDASTGKVLLGLNHFCPVPNMPINKFNCSGEAMLSAIGPDVMLWKPHLEED